MKNVDTHLLYQDSSNIFVEPCDVVNFTHHLKKTHRRDRWCYVPGKRVVWRETVLRRHPRALVTINTHYPHLRFLSRLFHTRHEDNGTTGQRRWRCGTTGFRETTYELRDIDASIIAAIDHWRVTHRTTSCHRVNRKTYSGTQRPQDLIFSIFDICDTKFRLNNIIGH